MIEVDGDQRHVIGNLAEDGAQPRPFQSDVLLLIDLPYRSLGEGRMPDRSGVEPGTEVDHRPGPDAGDQVVNITFPGHDAAPQTRDVALALANDGVLERSKHTDPEPRAEWKDPIGQVVGEDALVVGETLLEGHQHHGPGSSLCRFACHGDPSVWYATVWLEFSDGMSTRKFLGRNMNQRMQSAHSIESGGQANLPGGKLYFSVSDFFSSSVSDAI